MQEKKNISCNSCKVLKMVSTEIYIIELSYSYSQNAFFFYIFSSKYKSIWLCESRETRIIATVAIVYSYITSHAVWNLASKKLWQWQHAGSWAGNLGELPVFKRDQFIDRRARNGDCIRQYWWLHSEETYSTENHLFLKIRHSMACCMYASPPLSAM